MGCHTVAAECGPPPRRHIPDRGDIPWTGGTARRTGYSAATPRRGGKRHLSDQAETGILISEPQVPPGTDVGNGMEIPETPSAELPQHQDFTARKPLLQPALKSEPTDRMPQRRRDDRPVCHPRHTILGDPLLLRGGRQEVGKAAVKAVCQSAHPQHRHPYPLCLRQTQGRRDAHRPRLPAARRTEG